MDNTGINANLVINKYKDSITDMYHENILLQSFVEQLQQENQELKVIIQKLESKLAPTEELSESAE